MTTPFRHPVIVLLSSLCIAFQATAADAPKRRAWEDAPAEKKAAWEREKAALTILDISQETRRHVVIAQGSPQEYHAHPTTAMLADNRTIIAVWNLGHGGHGGPMARSEDGGLTWRRTDDSLPPNYWNFKNCPSIYRIVDPRFKIEEIDALAARAKP